MTYYVTAVKPNYMTTDMLKEKVRERQVIVAVIYKNQISFLMHKYPVGSVNFGQAEFWFADFHGRMNSHSVGWDVLMAKNSTADLRVFDTPEEMMQYAKDHNLSFYA